MFNLDTRMVIQKYVKIMYNLKQIVQVNATELPTRNIQCDALRDLVPFQQLKIGENTHGGVLLLVTFSNKILLIYRKF